MEPMNELSLVSVIDLFPPHERERVRLTSQRYAVAMEDVDDLLELHAADFLGPDRAKRWGRIDSSLNALAMVSHSLSNPGHYSRAPMLTGVGPELSDAMAPLWTASQHAEYLTYACGAVAVHVEPDPVDRVAFVVVPPHTLWADPDPARPTRPMVMRRLLIRTVSGKQRYTWDIWDLSDRTNPRYGIFTAERDGKIGEDVTAAIMGEAAPTAYPWTDPAGAPYIPWAIHRTWDVGDLWCWQRGRGVARGAVQSMIYWTAAGRAAIGATGKIAMVFGASPMGAGGVARDGAEFLTVDADPGDIVYHTAHEGVQPSISEIGEVDTLGALGEFAVMYQGQIQVSTGVMPTDATRASANPMSGSAISLSNETKRNEQLRANPLRRAADLPLVRMTAWLLDLDPANVGIVYHEIGRSPDEERQARDSTDWEKKAGLLSSVDVMMRYRPGLTREQALAEVQRVKSEEATLTADAGQTTTPLVGIVTASLDAVARVASGEIPREAGVQFLVEFAGMDPERADRLLSTAGQGFVPTAAPTP